MNQREFLLTHAANQYGISPEYLWEKFPSYAVLRHNNVRAKWFALIANVPKIKLGLKGEGNVEIANFKCIPELVGVLRQDKNILPAYHMNKEHWITVVLDNSIPDDELCQLMEESYRLTER